MILHAARCGLVAIACAAGCQSSSTNSDARVADVSVKITPAAPRTMVHNAVALGATVTGAGDQGVTWTIAEGGGGGSVSADGVYTASATPGSYHVTANSVAAPMASATVAITVVPPGTRPLLRTVTNLFSGEPFGHDGQSIVVLDADGDDRADVLVFGSNFPDNPNQTGRVRLWLRRDRGFEEATAERLGAAPVVVDSTRDAVVADLNGDGRDDVFAGQQGYDAAPFPGAHNLLLLSQPDGRLLEQAATRLHPYDHAFTHGVAAGDVDGDGDLDLFEANLNPGLTGPPHLQLNDGSGVFTEEPTRLPAVMRTDAGTFTSSAFCDTDRDGDLDLVLGGWPAGPGDKVLRNDGTGRFSDAPPGTLPPPPYSKTTVVKVVCVDVDGDGWKDLLLSANEEYMRSTLLLWMNDRTGKFLDESRRLRDVGSKYFHHEIDAADLNGDGLVDFAVSGWGIPPDCPSMLLVQQPDGEFTRFESPLPCGWLRTIQFDGDGRVDLLAYPYGRGDLPTIYINDGW